MLAWRGQLLQASFAWLSLLKSLLLLCGQDVTESEEPSLVIAMLARDEEGMLRRHLPEWRHLADAFVLGIDSRTLDRSENVAHEVLAPALTETYKFDFTGFGPAKSRLLEEVFTRFPGMEYVLLVEPDMGPVLKTFDRSVLRSGELVYAIRRSGKESRGVRLADSIFRNNGAWRFEFRVHETPVYRRPPGGVGVSPTVKDSGWTVVELEGSARDAQARAVKLENEMHLVDLDLKDFPGHPRLLYYAGTLRYELASELMSASPKVGDAGSKSPAALVGDRVLKLSQKAAKLLERRARDPGKTTDGSNSASSEYAQQRSTAAYYCARAHADLLGDVKLAEKWYKRTIKLEADFLYAHVALTHLLFRGQRYEEALRVALAGLEAGPPRMRLFMDSAPLHACDIPLLVSKALYYHYSTPHLRPKLSQINVWKRRTELLQQCDRECPVHAGDSAGRKLKDVQQLRHFWEAEGLR